MSIVRSSPAARFGAVCLLFLMVIGRVVDLGADAWPDLCWGGGIWTDEGFYVHNAVNAVRFGNPVQDEFNNRILSPWVDALQRAVFGIWGISLETVRWPSVFAGLVSLPVFWLAMRRRFGASIAWTALLLFGLEVSWLFTNRLGLLESIGVLVHCLAFLAWSVGGPWGWLVCGALVVAAGSVKTTFLILLPLPILVWMWGGIRDRSPWLRQSAWYTAGIGAALAVYLIWWGFPNGAEILRMNNFYRERQSQPRSFDELVKVVRRGLIGRDFGLFQRLSTRTPLLTGLALVGLFGGGGYGFAGWFRSILSKRSGSKTSRLRPRREAERLLWIWFLAGIVFLLASRYAPTRYYLVMHPAMAGLAAITLHRLPAWLRLWRRNPGSRPIAWGALFVLGFHAVQPILRLAGPLAKYPVEIGGCVGFLVATVVCLGLANRRMRHHAFKQAPIWGMGLFLIGSIGQIGWWWTHRTYQTRTIGRQLAALLPPGATLLGDFAPNLCIENKIRAIPVFRGLANDSDPVGRFRAEAVLVAQTPVPAAFWREIAPGVVVEENCVAKLTFHRWRLHVYRVPEALR